MRIETERLIIRTFEASYAEALYEIKNDPQMLRFIPDFIERDADMSRINAAIAEFRAMEDAGNIDGWRCYAIEVRETGKVVGCLSFGMSEMLHE